MPPRLLSASWRLSELWVRSHNATRRGSPCEAHVARVPWRALLAQLLDGWAHALRQNHRRGSAVGRPPWYAGSTCSCCWPGVALHSFCAEWGNSSRLRKDNMSVLFHHTVTRCPLWPFSDPCAAWGSSPQDQMRHRRDVPSRHGTFFASHRSTSVVRVQDAQDGR